MLDRECNGEVEDDENNSDSDGSRSTSPVGSTHTVHFKAAGNQVLVNQHNDPPVSSTALHALPNPLPSGNQILRTETCSILLRKKHAAAKFTTGNHIDNARWSCIAVVILIAVLLLGSLLVWVFLWKDAESFLWKSTGAPNISGNISDIVEENLETSCHLRSPIGFQSDLFTTGRSFKKVNPFHKSTNRKLRKVLEENVFRECQLGKADNHTYPSAHSTVIDSLLALRKWTARQLSSANERVDFAHTSAYSSDNKDSLSIQADLMAGSLVIITQLSLPLLNVSHFLAPKIEPKFAQQLNTVTDPETALELFEDFGDCYVDSAVIGYDIIIRFVLSDQTATDWATVAVSDLTAQANAAGIYLSSCANTSLFPHLTTPVISNTTINFLRAAKMQLYSASVDSSLIVTSSDTTNICDYIQSAFEKPSVIGVDLKPLSALFAQLPPQEASQLAEQWRLANKLVCSRLLSGCGKAETKNSHGTRDVEDRSSKAASVSILPLLSLWTTRGNTASLRTQSLNHCLQSCQRDPLCSAASYCARGPDASQEHFNSSLSHPIECPKEFRSSNCALHRQQEFDHANVSLNVITLIPVRNDLKPVAVRGYSIHGHAMFSTSQLADLASCTRLCSRTFRCRIVSFTHRGVGQKVCRLFNDIVANELRDHKQSTIIFLMATFGPCFRDEGKPDACPINAECGWHGMCVCRAGYHKHRKDCIATGKSNSIHKTSSSENYAEKDPSSNEKKKIATSTKRHKHLSTFNTEIVPSTIETNHSLTINKHSHYFPSNVTSNLPLNGEGDVITSTGHGENFTLLHTKAVHDRGKDGGSSDTSAAPSAPSAPSSVAKHLEWRESINQSPVVYRPWQIKSWKTDSWASVLTTGNPLVSFSKPSAMTFKDTLGMVTEEPIRQRWNSRGRRHQP